MSLSANETNVKVIRFLGEEVIAEVLSETATELKVKNPVRIVVLPNKDDPKNPNVAYAPYCEWTTDTEFTLSKNHVICVMNPLKVFYNQYKTQFSGVILPETKIIT